MKRLTSQRTPGAARLLFLAGASVLALACGSGGGSGDDGGAGASGSSAGGAGTEPGGAGASGAPSGGSTAGGAGGAAPANTFYVGPNGSDANPGTEAAPFKTLARGNEVTKAGGMIWVLPGTYQYAAPMILSKSGAEGNPIKIWAVPGARPVLDYSMQTRGASNQRGIEIRGNYWHIQGLEIQNAADNGIAISGSHNVVENVVLHGNGDTGVQITAGEGMATNDSFAADNLILNCDSYENLDVATGGENADGFAAKLRIGPGNVFRGCRAWNNADDGWDLFAADDVVVIEKCWAFLNGRSPMGPNPAGDGNGFKLGGEPTGIGEGGAVHLVSNNAAFENRSCGFTRNNNPELPMLDHCLVAANPRGDYCDGLSCSEVGAVTMTGLEAKAAPRDAEGNLPAIE